ncbi:MAG: DUF4402 domain-containing protein [Bacteroidota bacterium]
MKNRNYILLMLMLLTSTALFSQTNVNGTAFAEIVPLATISESNQLNFGRFSPLTGGGQITISPQGYRQANGSVILAQGPYWQAKFGVTNSQNWKVSVVLPSGPQLLYSNNSSNTMFVNGFIALIPETNESTDYNISIGATLNFGSPEATPPGLYSGTYQVIFLFD